jgi:hypothetical protein
MSARHTFDIYLPTLAKGGARVLIDDHELTGVIQVIVSGAVDGLTTVAITLHPQLVRVHGETERLTLAADAEFRYPEPE